MPGGVLGILHITSYGPTTLQGRWYLSLSRDKENEGRKHSARVDIFLSGLEEAPAPSTCCGP